jgi:hypothetical protein
MALFGSNISQQLAAELGDASAIVARVNEQPITSDLAEKRAQRLWGLSYLSLTSAQQRSIVELLVDEELLLQRAESLQLAITDPGLRKLMVAAAIEQVVDEFRRQPITEEQLLTFYRAHRSIFDAPIKIAVDAVRLEPSVDVPMVEALLAEGRSLASIVASLEHQYLAPRGPLTAAQHHRILGDAFARRVLALDEFEVAQALVRSEGSYFFQVTDIETRAPNKDNFEALRERVAGEYSRLGRRLALETKLDALWRRAQINSQLGDRERL